MNHKNRLTPSPRHCCYEHLTHTVYHFSKLEVLASQLQVEQRIIAGAENLLNVFENGKRGEEVTKRVESELKVARQKVANIEHKIVEIREALPGGLEKAIVFYDADTLF